MIWIDNADSWICNKCRFESLYLKPYCPRCNDMAENVENEDIDEIGEEYYEDI